MSIFVKESILNIHSYIPNKSIAFLQKKYGIKDFINLSSNENPYGPSSMALDAIKNNLSNIQYYPIEYRFNLKEQICLYHEKNNIFPNNIVLGNGSIELINLIVRTFLNNNEILLNAWPSFIYYRLAAKAQGCPEITVNLRDMNYNLDEMQYIANKSYNNAIKLIFIANPNNPTGSYININDMNNFFNKISENIIIVIDEAYSEYVDKIDYSTFIDKIKERKNTIVLKSFSKIFGLAGLRLGYAICDPEIASILHKVRDKFNVNVLAQMAALAALKDFDHIKKSKLFNKKELLRVTKHINNIEGIKVYQSVANFILITVDSNKISIQSMINFFITNGIIVRPLMNYNLYHSIRITIGSAENNNKLLQCIDNFINNL